MLQCAFAYCGCADDECAVGNCVGNAGERYCICKYRRGIDCRSRCLKGHSVVVYQAQMTKAEVVHGSSYSANIVGIACAHQDDAHLIELLRREHVQLL